MTPRKHASIAALARCWIVVTAASSTACDQPHPDDDHIITETGVLEPPYERSIAAAFESVLD